jgi:hypothetical protein
MRIPLLPFFLLFSSLLPAQNCDCTLQEVRDNTVRPCSLIIGTIDTVSTAAELKTAIRNANTNGGNATILIENGTYAIASTASYPYITASNVVFRSLSGQRDSVIITGTGMKSVAPDVENGFYFVGNNITIADLTIREVGNHGIAMHGDSILIHNVRIQNTYEQMIKGTSAGDGSDDCIVQCSLLEYPAGVGPQFYIGGLDIHRGSNWIVRDNLFKNISSPSGSLAEHAVHFWNNSSHNTVERNMIINCDRGIGFGLGNSANEGGIIRNNMIYNDGTSMFHDVGIGLETSPNTKVYNNTIVISYPNAIEYRFAATTGVDIQNNLTNKLIRSRNGAQANVASNLTTVLANWFVDMSAGDLHLNANIPAVVDQGADLSAELSQDMDQVPRPQGLHFDLGAHEYQQTMNAEEWEKEVFQIDLYPNPASSFINISTQKTGLFEISIFNQLNQEMAHFDPQYLLGGGRWIVMPGRVDCIFVK